MKINIKYHKNSKKLEQHGEWIDAFPRGKYKLHAPKLVINNEGTGKVVKFDIQLVDLGFSMALPRGLEANIVPRSSTGIKQGLLQTNHYGVIDTKYSGEQDIWKFPALAIKETSVGYPDENNKIKAICQFNIRPSMNAPWYVKLKWLFTSKIEFVEVDVLNGPNRGGVGSTD